MGINNTIAKVSKDTLKIQSFLEELEAGEYVSYSDIEYKTKVRMDTKGKSYLRTALKRAKIEYSPVMGKGIKLADSKTTMGLVVNRLNKIDRTVKRAEKTQQNLQTQFFESLEPQEQKQLLYIGAVFGAIRVSAENGKLLYQSKNNIKQQISIPLPEYK